MIFSFCVSPKYLDCIYNEKFKGDECVILVKGFFSVLSYMVLFIFNKCPLGKAKYYKSIFGDFYFLV